MKLNKTLLDKYFLSDNLILKRFEKISDIASMLDEDFKNYNIRVKEFEFKTYYDNAFQDYELMLTMGNKEENLIDITIYYAITRAEEKIITESSYEII